MPWTGKFIQDTERKGLGSAFAEFRDEEGKLICQVDTQVDLKDESWHGKFIEECQATLAKIQESKSEDDARQSLMAKLIAKLNG